jgi:MiaB-like tRNA modifying enzyme
MAKVFIKTFGCSLNSADSERMHGLIKEKGLSVVDDISLCEIVIINSCTVKSPTANKVKRFILESLKSGKKVVLAGCIPQADPGFLDNDDVLDEYASEISMLGPTQIDEIVQVIEETLNGNAVRVLVEKVDDKISMPLIRKSDTIEIIPICQGCLGEPCAYCLVKKARGKLRSYAPDALVKRIKKAVLVDKIKEIWLTAQDTGCYGYDIGTNIVELLNKIVEIKGQFRVRLGMANPDHVIENLDGLIDVYKSDKIFKFIHIPIQSGNDEILSKMKRKYTVKDFERIVYAFRKEYPLISISTDIISGFPTETQPQFKDSVELIKRVKPDVLNSSKFWLRPGTDAEKMEQVPGDIIKDRSRLISEVFSWVKRIQNKRWIGKECVVIVDEIGKEGSLIGRNESYKTVVLDKRFQMGRFYKVKIRNISLHDLLI